MAVAVVDVAAVLAVASADDTEIAISRFLSPTFLAPLQRF